MNAQFITPESRPPMAVITELIAEHGTWATVRAVLAAIVRRDRSRVVRSAVHLNDHLRRDIGLEREATPRMYWELRL